MSKTITRIGPADHGRPMDLDEFAEVEGQEGRVYELSRGIITVVEIPKMRHILHVAAAPDQLQIYKAQNPGRIVVIASGNECKLTIAVLGSERHPDLAVYLTPPPEEEDEEFWVRWVPEIVVEVVSPSSRKRDYTEKPEEYLRIGVKEYRIVDGENRLLTVLRRSRGRWVETKIAPPQIHRTRLLPGLAFSIESVFKSAGLV
jgi:Uma2 family endonuclease